MSLRVVFMGTPDFASASLEALPDEVTVVGGEAIVHLK